jgi:hypothetical protein
MSDQMKQVLASCVTGVILFGIFMGGIVSCTVFRSREQTRRVEAACAGDITNQARATPCAMAVMLSGKSPNN